MRRGTITAATAIVVLLACGRPESVEDRLIEAEKRLAVAEERLAAYERTTATATPTPTACERSPHCRSATAIVGGVGLTIRERYEALAHAGLVIRTEERRTLSGCPDSCPDWRYEEVVLFTVPKGLGGWVIRFTEVPGPSGYNHPQEGDMYVYHPSNPGSNQGYISAHNIWAHIMQLYSGRVTQWPR